MPSGGLAKDFYEDGFKLGGFSTSPVIKSIFVGGGGRGRGEVLTYYHTFFLAKRFCSYRTQINSPQLGHPGVHHTSRDNGNVIIEAIFSIIIFLIRCK